MLLSQMSPDKPQTNASDAEDAVVYHAHALDVPASPQAFDAVDLLRRFNEVATADKEVFRFRCPKQRSIMDFFLAAE